MYMKKITLFSIVLLMAFLTVAGLASTESYAASITQAPVSTGLFVLAADCEMAVSSQTGKEIAFSPEDFERALNLKRLDYITVTKAPDPALGTLYLGAEGISEGKTVSRENIHKLSYSEKSEGVSKNSFSFTTGNGYELECSVYMLAEQNYCPHAGAVGPRSNEASTYRNVSLSHH